MTDQFTKELPCRLTDGEANERAMKLARTTKEHADLDKTARDRAMADRRTLNGLLVEMRRLARVIEAREETRAVDCHLVFDRAHARAVEVRIDTGEAIGARAMTAAEIEAVDTGDLQAGTVPPEALEQVEAIVAAQDLDRRRAEFNLGAWASDRLTEASISRLAEEGLCEVDSLLAAEPAKVAKVAKISKAKAQELLDDLAESFIPAPPPEVSAAAWAGVDGSTPQ